jgi:hypothetical protein
MESWMVQARDGSEEALGKVLELCRPYLLAIVQADLRPPLKGKFAPSDLVQDTFLEAQRDCRGQFHGAARACGPTTLTGRQTTKTGGGTASNRVTIAFSIAHRRRVAVFLGRGSSFAAVCRGRDGQRGRGVQTAGATSVRKNRKKKDTPRSSPPHFHLTS